MTDHPAAYSQQNAYLSASLIVQMEIEHLSFQNGPALLTFELIISSRLCSSNLSLPNPLEDSFKPKLPASTWDCVSICSLPVAALGPRAPHHHHRLHLPNYSSDKCHLGEQKPLQKSAGAIKEQIPPPQVSYHCVQFRPSHW